MSEPRKYIRNRDGGWACENCGEEIYAHGYGGVCLAVFTEEPRVDR